MSRSLVESYVLLDSRLGRGNGSTSRTLMAGDTVKLTTSSSLSPISLSSRISSPTGSLDGASSPISTSQSSQKYLMGSFRSVCLSVRISRLIRRWRIFFHLKRRSKRNISKPSSTG